MTTQIQRRRGTTAQHSTFTGAVGEVTVDTDKEVLVVHDGAQVGGYPQMRENGSNSALALGSAGTPSLKFTGDTNTGIYSPGADQLALSTNGTGRLFVSANGVGIGAAEVTGYGGLQVRNNFIYVNEDGSNTKQLYIRTDTPGIQVASNDPFRILTNNQERLRITSAGLVGVGTSSPSKRLTIVQDGADSALRIEQSGEGYNFYRNQANGFLYLEGSQQTFSGFGFRVTPTGGSTTNAVWIDNSGRLGIGTSSPAQRLHVSGSNAGGFQVTNADNSDAISLFVRGGNAINSTTDNAVLHVGQRSDVSIITTGRVGIGTTGPTSTLSLGGNLDFQQSSNLSTTAGYLNIEPQSFLYVGGGSGAGVVLRIAGSEKARLDSSGRFLVGTSTASGNALLQVAGGIRQSQFGSKPDTAGLPSVGETRFYTFSLATINTWETVLTPSTAGEAFYQITYRVGISDQTRGVGFALLHYTTSASLTLVSGSASFIRVSSNQLQMLFDFGTYGGTTSMQVTRIS